METKSLTLRYVQMTDYGPRIINVGGSFVFRDRLRVLPAEQGECRLATATHNVQCTFTLDHRPAFVQRRKWQQKVLCGVNMETFKNRRNCIDFPRLNATHVSHDPLWEVVYLIKLAKLSACLAEALATRWFRHIGYEAITPTVGREALEVACYGHLRSIDWF